MRQVEYDYVLKSIRIIEPENIDAMVLALKQAAQSTPEKLETMGNNGYNFAFTELSKERNLDKISNIIMNI